MAWAREGAPGVLGAKPIREEGVPKTAKRAEARGKAFPLRPSASHIGPPACGTLLLGFYPVVFL